MYTPNLLRSQFISRTYIFDPADATVATKIAWVAMGVRALFKATLVSGTGILTFKVFAATDPSGTGVTVVVAHATPTTADAQGDQLVLSVDMAQVLNALPRASHVSVEMDCSGANDIVAVEYLVEPPYAKDGLTADVIA